MIYIGADHAGYKLKEALKKHLQKNKIEVKDVGAKSFVKKDDYPDYAKKVAKKVQEGHLGILICGTGIGMSIAANRYKGVRAGLVTDRKTAQLSKEHDHSNIFVVSGWGVSQKDVKEWLDVWLKTDYSKEVRHKRRVRKLG